MDKELMQQLIKYHEVFPLIGKDGISVEKLKNDLVEKLNASESTVYRYPKEFEQMKDGLIVQIGESLYINQQKAVKLLSGLAQLLECDTENPLNDKLSFVSEQKASLENQVYVLQEELSKKVTALSIAEEQIETLEAANQENMEQISRLEHEVQKERNQQKILIPASMEIGPQKGSLEHLFLTEPEIKIFHPQDEKIIELPSKLIEIPDDTKVRQMPGTDQSAGINSAGKELSLKNYRSRCFTHVATKGFLQMKLRKQHDSARDTQNPSETIPGRPYEAPQQKSIFRSDSEDSEEIQRKHDIQYLINTRTLTNQEKLGAYAFLCKYRGSEMQNLLRICIENRLYADAVIEIFESGNGSESYESMKELLNALMSPSEYKIKQQFAEELIAGIWYIAAMFNGKMTKFQLVPIDELNEIRAARNLPVSKFTYPETEPESIRKEHANRTASGGQDNETEESIPLYTITPEALQESMKRAIRQNENNVAQ